MIYLTDGNMPLNNAYSGKIVQEDGSTYQLTFRFPTSDVLWEKLKEETFLTADDLHGEQDFVVFEVEKKQGYVQVYANQVFTLLNNFVTGPISLDRVTGPTALSRFAGAITRDNPFSFFSDISERHTFNTETKNAMQVFAKDKHSILGQWGGDLVRHGYQVRLLKNGGSENESLFMYKKNLSSYQHKTSTKSLKTRITFKATVKGEGENAPDHKFSVVVDSPLINKYSQIYEDVIEVNDQDVKDEASLRKYGEQYFKTSLCDMMEDSLELEVVGQSDVPVQMYDIVSLFHEVYNLDVRKKITKYTYSPMAKKLISIGFGQFKSGLANAIGNAVSDAVRGEAQQLHDDFEKQLERELKNADLAFEHQKEELVNQFTDGLNAAKAKAEEVKAAMTEQLNLKINQSKSEVTERLKSDFDRKLATAQNDLAGVRANLIQAQSRLSGDISQIQSDIAAIRGKQSQADNELAKQVQSINQAKSELAGVKINLTQAQSQLSNNIAQIRSDVGSIRTKQGQQETEIGKQVQALNATKNELAGVKTAQATFEQTTTRRLAELTNLAEGKANKAELVQTAEELKSRIASLSVGENLFINSEFKNLRDNNQRYTANGRTYQNMIAPYWYNPYNAGLPNHQNAQHGYFDTEMFSDTVFAFNESDGSRNWKALSTEFKIGIITAGEYYFSADLYATDLGTHIKFGFYYHNSTGKLNFYAGQTKIEVKEKGRWVRLGASLKVNDDIDLTKKVLFYIYGYNFASNSILYLKKPKVSKGTLPSDWSPALEDTEAQISAVESAFKQRADSLEAGVSSLREGLKTKADSSALNLFSDRILASVKSLETNMDNKLDSKLSTAVFEVRASGIRQEIVNATKDKADKALVTAEAGRLREELASQIGSGRNLWINSKISGSPVVEALPAGHITGQKQCYKLTNNQELLFNIEPDFSSRLFRKVTFSAWIKYENVVRGANNWNMFNCFRHYMFLKNSKTGTVSGVSFLTLAGYDGTSDWKRIVFTYDYSANKGYDQLKTLLKFNLGSVRSGTAWITGIQVEFGSVANEYVPALEDTEGLITEAKATFERTAQGLRTDLSAVQSYVNADGTRAEALRTYSREETARQLIAERKLIEAGYVAQAQHTEDVRSISRRFEELKSSSETKLAQFKQGIDGQFATMSSQIGETLKKTDISITPGQIVLGTGKVVNGQTLASLFVQNPESMQAITKLMRITGDLIVDGSITGRDLAAGAITTPHLSAGAVTAEVIGANAVTADKVKADDALLEKLSAGEALLRKLMAKDAFINRLQSIDFTANQIRGGVLSSIDGTLNFDLNKNTLIMGSNTAAIKRVLPGHPTQFMRYETERKGNVDYTRTIIGSNRNGSEKFDSVTFAGLVVENSNKVGVEDSLRLYGDNTYFRHAQGEVGWNINAVTQRMAPATWQKESAVWSRSFVVPKHRNPNGRDWVKLEETVAALWRLWEHAAGNQVTMTGAMRDKVRELFQNYGYNYGIS